MSATDLITLQSGEFRIGISLEFGPRVLDARLGGSGNLFHNESPERQQTDRAAFRFRGGHRQWAAPEDKARCASPDNDPLHVLAHDKDKRIELEGSVEAPSGIRKHWTIQALPNQTFQLDHSMTNHNAWPIEAAVWTITMMAKKGVGIVPLPSKVPHSESLLPTWSIVPWTYTDLSSPSLRWTPEALLLDSRKTRRAEKVGFTFYPGWSACWNDGLAFVKYAEVFPEGTYPDRGCCFESYWCPSFLELETLAPLETVAPGAGGSHHREFWTVLKEENDPTLPGWSFESFATRVSQWISRLPTAVSPNHQNR